MKIFLAYLLVAFMMSGCEPDTLELDTSESENFEPENSEPATGCMYNAVVEDHSELDGCSYLFKLQDGEYLEPIWRWGWCATPPLPEGAIEDPLGDFENINGKQVLISFEYTDQYASTCMKGKPVIVTCIETIESEPDHEPQL